MDLPHGGRRQGLAGVTPYGPSRALRPAAPEPCVEVLEQLGVDLCDRQVSERGPDVLLDLAEVAGARREVELDDLKPPVEQLRERGGGPGLPALVDLVEQPDPGSLCLGRRVDDLAEVVLATGERVDAGVHPHAELAARQLFDTAAVPLPTGRTSGHAGHCRPHPCHEPCHGRRQWMEFSQVGRVGLEPTTEGL